MMEDGIHDAGGYRPPVLLSAALAGARRVVITAHVDPDPDALGCALGLSVVLAREGWDVLPVCVGNVPSFAETLPGFDRLVQFPSSIDGGPAPQPLLTAADALVVCDTPTASRMAAFYDLHAATLHDCPVIVFDHHITNDQYGTTNYVDPSAASSAEVVCDVLEASGIALDRPSATCFMTALLADTQTFRTESTSPRSLLWGYRFAALGVPIFPITQMLFKTRPLVGIKLWGAALQTLEAQDDIVWVSVTQEMLRTSGSTMEEAEGLVDFLLSSRGTRAAIVFKQQPNGETKVSMRTVPGVDATRVVGAFGGGGHQRAAGCTISAPPDGAASLLLPHAVAEVRASAAAV
jgi:phosphoesterase RecJ-like protein